MSNGDVFLTIPRYDPVNACTWVESFGMPD
jgi:hypothetical protein